MNKILFILLTFCISSLTFAEDRDKTLLSAQVQYQNALKAQDTAKERASRAQTRLDTAKNRIQDAQRELQDSEKEYSEAMAAQAKATVDFDEAGRNLDQAWGVNR